LDEFRIMPQLNLREIPQANVPTGGQDTFELFARDFLEMFGYVPHSGPDRGADLGRDLVVQEKRTGVGGETIVKWLVSCKHKAHSNQSVFLSDEPDILDRVRVHDCSGFIGFYSTIPASSLVQKLEQLKINTAWFDFQTFDREKIESILLRSGVGQGIAQRYFPNSYVEWSAENFNIDVAMSRIGMPQPVNYRRPNEEELLTLEEVLKLYPQGNRYIFNPWLPGNLIFCNNILGITKILGEGGRLIDPPLDYFQKMNESFAANVEALKHHVDKNPGGDEQKAETTAPRRIENKRSAKRRIAKKSRKHNRKQ
jgi:hypothetical protein